MSNEILEKFSEELKSAREKKKIKLEQIFNKTRIDIKYLEAIETGNFSIMPEVYIRAFLKEYAEYIGLNPNEILEKYKLAQSGKLYSEKDNETQVSQEPIKQEEDKPKFISEDLEEKSNENIKSQSVNSLYYIFASIVMLIFIYFIYDSFLSDKSVNNVKEKPFAEVLKAQDENEPLVKNSDAKNRNKIDVNKIKSKKIENIKRTQPVTSQKETALVKEISQNKGNLDLTIIGEGKSWMRVVIDGDKNHEFIIDEGIKKKLFANNKFYIHIGNSAGVKLLLNGKELYFKKAEGRVKKFNITKDGIKYIKRKVVQQNEN
jgi:cytoskeletal protein RodZ